jgi:nitrite reductase (NADH) large subunit
MTMLKVSGVDLTSVGVIEGVPGDEEVVEEDPLEGRYKKLVRRDGLLIGAILLNHGPEAAEVANAVHVAA